METLTDDLERRAWDLIQEVEERGGAVAAIESGFVQEQIAESAYAWEVDVASGERTVVGVNKYRTDGGASVPIMRLNEDAIRRQIARVVAYRERQGRERVADVLGRVERVARGSDNLLPVMKDALLAGATLGEICGRLRGVWGEYRLGG
ncbi:Methylmalonyl-CoA mutase, large subunit (fragment, part 2) [Nitrolancea hollandica Lb]|uniref:Methylmalonyl-CoA mutase, large subunit (Fragment, part 2) n=1 Tax=Nitrolancea hollandica Lb TaxID=1129897 RepID=I4EIA5_9BACT|nr:Methylmalonyl-CoA mutase, large subunit (fragment, part 2) [Nitrolancea hollandica Lb]